MRLPTLLLAASSLLLAGSFATEAFAAQCLQAGGENEVAEGLLINDTFHDAAGREEDAYILSLSGPVCMTGSDENDQIDASSTIHIFASDEGVHESSRQFLGKEVMVRGMPFGAMTMHHHAPIVMDITEIDGL